MLLVSEDTSPTYCLVNADIVPLERVAVVRGYVNVVGIAGRSLGGPAGGFLADTVGWKW